MTVDHLTDDNFDDTINKTSPIIVDFWATWCGPCQMMGPVFEELSDEFDGKLKFAKVNTDDAPDAAQKSSIMSIPALVVYKDGKEVNRIIGALPKAALKEKIESML